MRLIVIKRLTALFILLWYLVHCLLSFLFHLLL